MGIIKSSAKTVMISLHSVLTSEWNVNFGSSRVDVDDKRKSHMSNFLFTDTLQQAKLH